MIYLRPLYSFDIDRLYEIKSNPLNFDIKFTNFDTTQVTLESIKEWYYNIAHEIDTVRLGIVLKETNILIGSITLGKVDYIKSYCQLHIFIDIQYQNKGYGKSALLTVIEYIKTILKIKNIILNVHKDHSNAIKLYNYLGFISCGQENNYIIMIYNND